MTRLISVAAAVVALFAGAAVWQATRPADLPGLGVSAAEAAEIDTSLVTEMSLGDPDAPVTVIEYASFTCPHCKSFHAGPFKQLKADYIDTGKVHFIYREVYFDRFGLWAGMVARCGARAAETAARSGATDGTDPGAAGTTMAEQRYFGIAGMIYDQQAEWTKGETPVAIADNLRRIGRTAGLANEDLDACLTDGDLAQAMVAVWEENKVAHDIDSTPSFVIDGEKYSNMPYSEFSAILDEKLAE